MKRYNNVDDYIQANPQWKEILLEIRNILNGTELEETVKWGAPAYTYQGKNLVGLGAFKEFTSVWFHQGALLKDPYKKLINAQEGKTQALRQWRIKSNLEFDASILKEYVSESIKNFQGGLEIKPRKDLPLEIPVLLKEELSINSNLNQSFSSLSLSKQREYVEYIDTAKRDETKQKRLEKIIPMIISGVGLNDKYR